MAAGRRCNTFAASHPVGPLQVAFGPPATTGAGDFGTAGLVALPDPQLHRLGGLQVGGEPGIWALLEPIKREVFWVAAGGQGKLVELHTPGGVGKEVAGGQ